MGWFMLCLILFIGFDSICDCIKKLEDTIKRQGEWLRDEIKKIGGGEWKK